MFCLKLLFLTFATAVAQTAWHNDSRRRNEINSVRCQQRTSQSCLTSFCKSDHMRRWVTFNGSSVVWQAVAYCGIRCWVASHLVWTHLQTTRARYEGCPVDQQQAQWSASSGSERLHSWWLQHSATCIHRSTTVVYGSAISNVCILPFCCRAHAQFERVYVRYVR